MEKAIKRYLPIFVLPTLAAFIIGFIAPFIMGVGLSFCEFTTVKDAKFVGISNYVKAFQDTIFRHSFWYTALFAIVSLIVINVCNTGAEKDFYKVTDSNGKEYLSITL